MKQSRRFIALALFYAISLLTLPILTQAQPPWNELTTGSLEIISAHNTYIKQDSTNTAIYFLVYNSTKHELNNTEANCTIHVYNSTNQQHVQLVDLTRDSNGQEFKHVFNWSLFGTGVYPYIVSCFTTSQTPNEEGLRRGEFIINHSGKQESESNLVLVLYALSLIITALLVFYFIVLIGKTASAETGLYDVALNMALYFSLYYTHMIAVEFISTPNYLSWNSFFITYLAWTNVVWPIISFIISFFWRVFHKKDNIKDYNGRVF